MTFDKINVAIKCRPLSDTEVMEETMDFFNTDENNEKPHILTTLKTRFEFKYIFKAQSKTIEVYDTLITPMLNKALNGFNCTILAYGQTGSGKTFTLGTELTSYHEGITQMVLNHLFQVPGLQLKMSVLEIYLKDCYDLLHALPLKINIQGLKPVSVALQDADNLETAMELLISAVKNRRVGATASNKRSSRSHMIVTLYIETPNYFSKFNIVDLAGSEKIHASTGTLRNEGVAINEALLSLGRVVNCLAQAKSHIPFRDSPLTHLLEDSLKRDNYITLIGCINSLKKNVEESEKTLEFASKFAGISASRMMIGTPYKTPSRFVNHTFTSGNVFKKPLTPLNKTIATTPISWGAKKREQHPDIHTGRDALNSSNISLNLSNVSTSTALPENSPTENQRDVFSSALHSDYDTTTMTPAILNNVIKATVDRALKNTIKNVDRAVKNTIKKEMSQIFKTAFDQKENAQRFNRLLEVDTYRKKGESSSAADDSSDSDVLQTTVVGHCTDLEILDSGAPSSEDQSEPPSKIPVPKISSSNTRENLNGSYISDFESCSPNIQGEEPAQQVNLESSSRMFKLPAPRRSARLSIMRSSFEGIPVRKGDVTDSDLDCTPDLDVFKKPQMHRYTRRCTAKRTFVESECGVASGSRGGDTDSSLNSNPDSDVFKKPPVRRSVRRSVFKRPRVESESDEAYDNRDSGIVSETEVSNRAPRRSMRLSIQRPVESDTDLPSNKARRSFTVALSGTDSSDTEKPKKPRGKKATSAADGATSIGNIIHEKRILKILQDGSLKDLLKLPTVGDKTAVLILNDRLLHGPVKKVTDFAKIRGVTSNHGKKFLWANSLI